MGAQAAKKRKNPLGILIPVAIFVAVAALLMLRGSGQAESRGGNTGAVRFNEQGDLVIALAEVTETATFYPLTIDGTELEILAVRASDGTVRTAFNTCQVCYRSGQGYYRQEGEYLVCQNCGSRFHTDDVEVVRGGCNPIPITDAYKQTDPDAVTIPAAFLTEASALFTNWR